MNAPLRWAKVPSLIYQVAERLKNVQIENMPAVNLISKYNFPEVLIYCDPPYPLNTRSQSLYKYEMSRRDHLLFLRTIRRHCGPVLISGYDNPMYNRCLKRWHKEYKKNQTEFGLTRTEVLWINPVAARQINVGLGLDLD